MKKSMLSLLISLVLLAAAICAPAATLGEAANPQADTPAPPAIGDIVHGFKTIDVYEISLLDITCVVMEHENTGAQLAYLACEDTNRAFSISFRTPAADDKGIPHVFEHATLCGSEKYPDPSLFFSMISQTYNTFLNAMTMQTHTTYPNASLSEEQLLRFMDYTLSGVFYPTILTDERAMLREAYRYELANKDADIALLGTVYSEMQGAMTINTQATYNLNKQLYPGSITSNNPGGDPAIIPTITHQELKDFHNAYYHPSNALILLYGKLDYTRFLQAIDEDFLSKFDRRTIEITDDAYRPWEGYREAVCTFPATQDAMIDPVASYGISMPGATVEECILLDFAIKAAVMDGATFYTRVKEKLPNITLLAGVDASTAEPTLVITGVNVGEADMHAFKDAVDEALAQLYANGLDMAQTRTLCRQLHYNTVIAAEDPNRGISFVQSFANAWGQHGDVFEHQANIDVTMRIVEYTETDAFNEVFRKYTANPVRSAYVVTVPERGGLERQAAALKQSLADMKAAMTDAEVESLVARTADFAAWTKANAENSMIDQIKVVDARTLPEEVVSYSAQTSVINGMRAITSQVAIADLLEVSIQFDASAVPEELLHAYALYNGLLGYMATETRSREEVVQALDEAAFSKNFYATTTTFKDGGDRPTFSATWCTTLDRIDDSFAIIEDILFHTDFSDADLIRMRAFEYGQMHRLIASAMPDMLMASYAIRLASDDDPYPEYIDGLPFMRFMKRVETMTDEEIAQLAVMMNQARDILLNQSNFLVTCVGGQEAIDLTISNAEALYARLDTTPREAADYTTLPPLMETPLAIVIDGMMQFNAQAIAFSDCGLEDNGKLQAMSSLVFDKVLMNVLRFQNAAYGARITLKKPVILVGSYRDPNLAKTFDVFAQLGDLIRALPLTQDDLDGYISNIYSSLAMPCGQFTGGQTAVKDAISGEDTFGDTLRFMREIKQFTLEDVRAYAALFDTLAANGVQVTVGGMEAIQENSDLFKTVITDFMEE